MSLRLRILCRLTSFLIFALHSHAFQLSAGVANDGSSFTYTWQPENLGCDTVFIHGGCANVDVHFSPASAPMSGGKMTVPTNNSDLMAKLSAGQTISCTAYSSCSASPNDLADITYTLSLTNGQLPVRVNGGSGNTPVTTPPTPHPPPPSSPSTTSHAQVAPPSTTSNSQSSPNAASTSSAAPSGTTGPTSGSSSLPFTKTFVGTYSYSLQSSDMGSLPTPSESSTSGTGAAADTKHVPLGAILGGVLGGLALLLIAAIILVCYRRRRKARRNIQVITNREDPASMPPMHASTDALVAAENYRIDTGYGGYSKANMMAEGSTSESSDPLGEDTAEATAGSRDSLDAEIGTARRQFRDMYLRLMRLEESRGEREQEKNPPPSYSARPDP